MDFDGRVVTYDPGEKDEITLAYAVTVHKAQGSEFPGVLIVLSTHHFMLLQRNLLYTALTRGRRLVVLLGSKRALGMAIHNDRPVKRYTYLAPRLREALGPTKAVKMLDIFPDARAQSKVNNGGIGGYRSLYRIGTKVGDGARPDRQAKGGQCCIGANPG